MYDAWLSNRIFAFMESHLCPFFDSIGALCDTNNITVVPVTKPHSHSDITTFSFTNFATYFATYYAVELFGLLVLWFQLPILLQATSDNIDNNYYQPMADYVFYGFWYDVAHDFGAESE